MQENESNNNNNGESNGLISSHAPPRTADTKYLDKIKSISKSWVLLRLTLLLLVFLDPTCMSIFMWINRTLADLVTKKYSKRPNRNSWISTISRFSEF